MEYVGCTCTIGNAEDAQDGIALLGIFHQLFDVSTYAGINCTRV